MNPPLLMGRQYMTNPSLVSVNLLIQIQYRPSGVAKNYICALLQQRFHQYLRACHLHNHLSFVLLLYSSFVQIKRPDSERCRVVLISVKANIAIPADSLKSEHHSKDRCHCQNQKQHAAKKDVQIFRYEFCSHKNFLFCKIVIFCTLCTFPRT